MKHAKPGVASHPAVGGLVVFRPDDAVARQAQTAEVGAQTGRAVHYQPLRWILGGLHFQGCRAGYAPSVADARQTVFAAWTAWFSLPVRSGV